MKRVIAVIMMVAVASLLALPAFADDHPSDQPITLAFDMGFIPMHWWTETGEAVGYGIDVSREIAQRLGRPGIKIIDTNWSGIFSGLFAKQWEAVFFSVYITEERAEMMDFTEPFLCAPEVMMVRAEEEDQFQSPESFRGYTIGVSAGATADVWATDNAEKYGFKVQRYDKINAVVLALKTHRIDGVAANAFTLQEFIKKEPSELAQTFTLAIPAAYGLGRRGEGMAFRIGDPFRDEVERVLEGMKLDGTLQGLGVKYFSADFVYNDWYEFTVFNGYGCPGVRGYEPKAFHQPYFPAEESAK